MIVIVDAYNVLKQISRTTLVSEAERKKFIGELARYADIKKISLLIIFDGGIYGLQSTQDYKRVTVIYSGARQSADEYIQSYITEYSTQDLFLVSSDTALRSFADSYQIPSISAQEFYILVRNALTLIVTPSSQKGGELIKTTDTSNTELEKLMEEGSRHIPHKDKENDNTDTSLHTKTLTKKERMLLHKLKKL